MPVIEGGKRVYEMPSIREIRDYAAREIASLSDEHKRLDSPHIYKVDLSDKLYELKTSMIEEIRKGGEQM